MRVWIAVASLTAIALALRLPHMGESLFADELFAYVEVHGHSLREVITNVSQGEENSPPLYFVFAWFSIKLGDPTVLIRLPSLVFGTLAVPAVYLAGARIGGRTPGLIAAGLTALSPFAVYFSTEARPYATTMFLLALSTFALLQAIDDGRRGWWVLYWATAAGALFSHYTAVPVIAVQAAWALWAHRDRAREVIAVHAAMGLAILAWVPLLVRQRGEAQDLAITGSVFPLSLESVGKATAQLIPGYERFEIAEVPGAAAMWMLAAALAIATAGVLWRLRDGNPPMGDERRRRLALAAGLALAAPVALLLYSAFGSDLYNARRLLASFPGFVIVVGALLAAAPRAAAVPATALVIFALAIGLSRAQDVERARPPLKAAARYIDSRADRGDPVVESVFLAFRGLFTHHLAINFEKPHPRYQTGLVTSGQDFWERLGERRLFVVEAWGNASKPSPLRAPADERYRLTRTRVWTGRPSVAVHEYSPLRTGAER